MTYYHWVSPDQQRSLDRLDTQVGLHVTTGIEIGKEPIHLKSITPHGQFTQLVEWRFGFKKVQQSKYIKIAESFGNQKFTAVNFSTNALYELSKAPDPEEALLEAQAQESLTAKQAKEIADLHKRIDQADEEISEAMKEVERANRSERISDKAINLANEARIGIQEKYDKLQSDYEDAVDEGARKVNLWQICHIFLIRCSKCPLRSIQFPLALSLAIAHRAETAGVVLHQVRLTHPQTTGISGIIFATNAFLFTKYDWP